MNLEALQVTLLVKGYRKSYGDTGPSPTDGVPGAGTGSCMLNKVLAVTLTGRPLHDLLGQ